MGYQPGRAGLSIAEFWRPQLNDYRTFVGLDVHARTIIGSALDALTGEVLRHRFGSDLSEVVAWTRSLPGPQIAAYEAGPTGFGLYLRLLESGPRVSSRRRRSCSDPAETASRPTPATSSI